MLGGFDNLALLDVEGSKSFLKNFIEKLPGTFLALGLKIFFNSFFNINL